MGPVTLAVLILLPQRMYYQPGYPVPIRVDLEVLREVPGGAAGGAGDLQLHLLSMDGEVVATVAAAREPEFDLAKAFAGTVDVWDGRTRLVQVSADGVAVGTPLVVVPLTSPGDRPGGAPHGLRVVPLRDAVLRTDRGDIRVALAHGVAPNTVMHFEYLVDGGFYTNVVFHRIIPGFVIQGGDPTGTGTGGPGYMLDLEASEMKHDLGVLSMARRGNDVNSSGSQFFICLSRENTQALDGQYTAFGRVINGLDAVEAIAGAEIADQASGRPRTPPVIKSAEMVGAEPWKISPVK